MFGSPGKEDPPKARNEILMQTDLTGARKIPLNTTELREEEKKTWEEGKGLKKYIKRALKNIWSSLCLIKNKMLCELQIGGIHI